LCEELGKNKEAREPLLIRQGQSGLIVFAKQIDSRVPHRNE